MRLVIVLAAGCGRVGFGGMDAPPAPDVAVVTADAPEGNLPLHRYRLANTYADDMGGPPLASLGDTFDSSGYRFGVNQGLAVANAIPIDVYTIDMIVAFDDLSGFRKLVDFKGLATDEGAYVENARFAVVADAAHNTVAESAPVLVAAVPVELTLTRDAAGVMIGYVAKARELTLTDALGAGTFTAQFATANFAIDDHATNQGEAGSGVIREIRIWNRALTAAEIAEM